MLDEFLERNNISRFVIYVENNIRTTLLKYDNPLESK